MPKKKKFKFTLISAVYNVEKYVAETINSIIKQDIGFKDNVQLILVNDGSSDNSGLICDKYAKKYPNNIKVIHKQNGGVSSARNEGFKYIEGKYFNFIDSDDKFTKNTLSSVWNFFEKHENEIDVCTIPIHLFEARTGPWSYNEKFEKGTRVIDLTKDYKCATYHCTSTFFHNRVKDIARFDTRLSISEDVTYVSQIILQKLKLGVVTNCKFLYRKRFEQSSAIQNCTKHEKWYFNALNYYILYLINYSKSLYGKIPKFLQYTLINDIRWKLNQKASENMYYTDKSMFNIYKKLLYSCYKEFDISSILENEFYSGEDKLFIIRNIFEKPIQLTPIKDGNEFFCIDKKRICWLSHNCTIFYQFINIENHKIKLEFAVKTFEETKDYEPYIQVDGKFIKCKKIGKTEDVFKLDEIFYQKEFYQVEFNITQNLHYFSIYLKRPNTKHFSIIYSKSYGTYFPINYILKSYYYSNNYIFRRINDCTFMIKKCTSFIKKIGYELRYDNELRKIKNQNGWKLIFIRWLYKLRQKLPFKKRWLITDRPNKAGDNGEAFLKFLVDNKIKNIKYTYAINNKLEIARLKKIYKNIIPINSKKYYKEFLFADNIISSHADTYVIRPLGDKHPYIRDLLWNKNFIFLQHGVANNDLSNWLNRFNKNVSGLITSSKKEFDMFLNTNCFYEKNKIWLTGIARFDYLYNDEKNIVTIMPTWRLYLSDHIDPVSKIWILKPDFKNSEFYKFYNKLINDEEIIDTCKKYNYKLLFFPHPNLIPYINLFDKNEFVDFANIESNYSKMYAESNLIVTDYSSSIYDFIYLNKPIMYTHFDLKEMEQNEHVYKLDKNDYKNEGFGEVCYNYESTKNLIITYIKSNCKLKSIYKNRIQNFFKYRDKNNCSRIYNQILQLNKRKK